MVLQLPDLHLSKSGQIFCQPTLQLNDDCFNTLSQLFSAIQYRSMLSNILFLQIGIFRTLYLVQTRNI